MEAYYINSDRTKKINLNGDGREISDMDVFKHELQYTNENDKIKKFKRGIQSFEIEVNVTDLRNKSWKEIYDDMMQVFDNDALYASKGKLYINNCFINCFIYALQAQETFEDWGFQIVILRIVTDDSAWITEQSFTFLPASLSEPSIDSDNLDFPFDFPFDFASSGNGTEHRIVDHYASSHFRMTVHGPCVNPRISISGYPRQVFATLEANEYMIIDSKDNTITKYLMNGTTENLYNSRQFEPRIFEKIPGGNLAFDWPRTFGFDITLYLERSEPRWC